MRKLVQIDTARGLARKQAKDQLRGKLDGKSVKDLKQEDLVELILLIADLQGLIDEEGHVSL